MLKDAEGKEIVLGSRVVFSSNNRLRTGKVVRIRTDATVHSTYVKTIFTVEVSFGKRDQYDWNLDKTVSTDYFKKLNLFTPDRVLVIS